MQQLKKSLFFVFSVQTIKLKKGIYFDPKFDKDDTKVIKNKNKQIHHPPQQFFGKVLR